MPSDTYPCTPLQAGMLYQQMMAPHDTHANEPLLAVLDGPLDVARMDMAWAALVKRHTILRTYFGWSDDDQPCQCVLDLPPLPPTLETLASGVSDLDGWLDLWAASARWHLIWRRRHRCGWPWPYFPRSALPCC